MQFSPLEGSHVQTIQLCNNIASMPPKGVILIISDLLSCPLILFPAEEQTGWGFLAFVLEYNCYCREGANVGLHYDTDDQNLPSVLRQIMFWKSSRHGWRLYTLGANIQIHAMYPTTVCLYLHTLFQHQRDGLCLCGRPTYSRSSIPL